MDAAKRAASLAPREALLRERRQQETSRREAVQAAERLFADASAAHQKALAELSAWNARKSERELLHTEVVQFEALRGQVARVEQAEKSVAEAEQKLAEARRSAEASAMRLQSADRELAAATESLGRAKEASGALQSAELVLSNRSRQVKDRQALDDLRGTIREHARQHEEAEHELRAFRETIRDMKANLADLQRAYIEGHAAQLAVKLADGQPCPVCGSIEHPAPARSDRPVPPWEQVEQQQHAVDRQEKQAQLLAKAAGELAAELAGRRATEHALEQALAETSGEALQSLIAKQQSARQQFEIATKASRQVPELEKSVASATAKGDQAAIAHDQLLQARRTAETEVSTRQAARSETIQGVPQPLRHAREAPGRPRCVGRKAETSGSVDRVGGQIGPIRHRGQARRRGEESGGGG